MIIEDDRDYGGRYELVWRCNRQNDPDCEWEEIEQKYPRIKQRKMKNRRCGY